MTPIPKPDIQVAVEALRDREEYAAILQFIHDEREKFFGDFRQAESSNDVMKLAGSISTLDELLSVLAWQTPIIYLDTRIWDPKDQSEMT